MSSTPSIDELLAEHEILCQRVKSIVSRGFFTEASIASEMRLTTEGFREQISSFTLDHIILDTAINLVTQAMRKGDAEELDIQLTTGLPNSLVERVLRTYGRDIKKDIKVMIDDELIAQAQKEGYSSTKAIADYTGLSVSKVHLRLFRKRQREQPYEVHPSRFIEESTDIAYAQREGKISVNDISTSTGLKDRTVVQLLGKVRFPGLTAIKLTDSMEQTFVNEAIFQGAVSVDDVYALTGMNHRKIITYLSRLRSLDPEEKIIPPLKRNLTIESMVLRNETIKGISEETGLSTQRISQYLISAGLMPLYKENRKVWNQTRTELKANQEIDEEIMIAYAQREGNISVYDIAQATGLQSERIAYHLIKHKKEEGVTNKLLLEKVIVHEALSQGAVSVNDVYALTGMNHIAVIRQLNEKGFKIKRELFPPNKIRNMIIEGNLWRGETARELGVRAGLTTGAVFHYLYGNGLSQQYKDNREVWKLTQIEIKAYERENQ